jgi:hypothetical protein
VDGYITTLLLLPFRGAGFRGRGLAESYDHEKCKNDIHIGESSNFTKFFIAFGAFVISSMNENNTNNGNNNEDNGPSTPTNCALSRGTGEPLEFICLDTIISKMAVKGMTIKDSSFWETCYKHSSGTLSWQHRLASYQPLSSKHWDPMALIIVSCTFLNFFFLGEE